MKLRRVKCNRCGTNYRARTLRCPTCDALTPLDEAGGLKASDWLVGVLFLVLGLVFGIGLAIWFINSGPMRGIHGPLASIPLVIVPVGLVFHGILLLMGIHPRDFYEWWDRLPGSVRRLAWCFLALLVVIFFIACYRDEAAVVRR
jgi:hypothetical protein